MKRILKASIAILTFAFVFTACSTTKNTNASNTSATTISRGKFVGTWTLTSVSYDGLVPSAVQNVFDQAAPNDFTGSIWKLTNSGNGIYNLTNGQSQTIFWSIFNDNINGTQFQFKKLYQGDKAKNVNSGYRLVIANITDATMTLQSPVAIGTRTGYVIYNFTKGQ